MKTVWWHLEAYTKHDILYFGDNVRLLEYYLVKVPFQFLKFPNFHLSKFL